MWSKNWRNSILNFGQLVKIFLIPIIKNCIDHLMLYFLIYLKESRANNYQNQLLFIISCYIFLFIYIS